MKVTLLLVGVTTGQELQALITHYARRLTHYLPFTIEHVPAPKATRSLSSAQQKEQEGQALLHRIPPTAHLVLLDEHGPQPTSPLLAQWLEKRCHAAVPLVFAIGGPYGFSDAVRSRANETLSLSRLTFSHQMVRLIFIEQLYRACTILRGEPYHHE